MADGAILPLPQHHQADDYDGGNGHRNDQQADEGTAAQTEVLPQRPHRFLRDKADVQESPRDYSHGVAGRQHRDALSQGCALQSCPEARAAPGTTHLGGPPLFQVPSAWEDPHFPHLHED